MPTDESNLHLQLRDDRSPITPREHQLAAWDRMTAHFLDAKRRAGLIVVPTGGGKTVIAAHWLLEHHIRNGGRVLWLAHRRSLLRQALGTFRQLGNVAWPKRELNLVAISSDDARWSNVTPEHDVVFATMQTSVLETNSTFVHVMREMSPQGLFVVVDEAHHAPAPGYSRLLRKLKEVGCPLLGLTATPIKADAEDQRRLSALFEESVVYQITRRELTVRGILAAPSFKTVKTEVNLEKDFTPEDYAYLSRHGALAPVVLERLAKHAGRNKMIVEEYVKNASTYGPTIVFAADTLHASTLADEFHRAKVSVDYVDYSRKDAQQVIQKYKDRKEPDVLVNVEMLTEGFDAPHTRTVFIARPTRSEALLAQMVGRALRGKQSGGNEVAHLVTFLDTWEQFQVLDAEYVLGDGEDTEAKAADVGEPVRLRIPPELVAEAYRMLQSNVKGQLTGVFQCLPYGWFVWEESFEDDQQRRTVMIYEHQLEGYDALLAQFASPESVPESLTEDTARELVRRHFGDIQDPLPRWGDVRDLLEARRKGCEIHRYTFEEKNEFDPAQVAKAIVDGQLTPSAKMQHVQSLWDAKPACRLVYRGDFQSFLEDVTREELIIVNPPRPAPTPDVVAIVPTQAPRAWPDGRSEYGLVAIRDAVLAPKRHFPNGAPVISDLTWSRQVHKRAWAFYRYSDKTVTINCALNSPDVPRFVVEFLMFHELLHADMPSAGHNRDFRQRERAFQPSPEAVDDAKRRGIVASAGAPPDYWRARADMFLDSFTRYFAQARPGTSMEL